MTESAYSDLDRPPLDAALLRRALVVPRSRWVDVEVRTETASTNAALAARAHEDPRSGLVLLAEYQWAGRGRLDRAWTAPPRSGITMSVLLRPVGVQVSRWPWIPLLSGLAVAAAVRDEARVEATLKWPNDVVVGDRKLAGVLVERVDTTTSRPAAVIGIGLNVSLRADELPTANATSLAIEAAATTDRTLLVKAVLRSLDGLMRWWEAAGGDPKDGLHAAYVDACSTLGRAVRIALPHGGSEVGEAVGIDSSGRLLVRTTRGQQAFGAGDVVHLLSDS
ncbi:MAG: biotin--[acetyl-CoA-carboxylase] ligase [Nocardioidaceae bacterium]